MKKEYKYICNRCGKKGAPSPCIIIVCGADGIPPDPPVCCPYDGGGDEWEPYVDDAKDRELSKTDKHYLSQAPCGPVKR